ncbi:MAG: FHA domain-containing protein [Pirellulales bacterium]
MIPCGGGDSIPLMRPKLLIGRKSLCDVTLPFSNVSSRHCELHLERGYWRVRDVGSTNGIQVAGQPCDADWLLPGDELSVANHRYTIRYQPPPDSAPPHERTAGPQFDASLMALAGVAEDAAGGRADRPDGADRSGLGELVPVGGGAPIALLKMRILVGRHGSCDVALPYPTVSARHCELEFLSGRWLVRDLGSRNGTRIDGAVCQSEWLLPEHILSIAKYRFKAVYTAREDAPLPDADKMSLSRSLLEKAGLARRKN